MNANANLSRLQNALREGRFSADALLLTSTVNRQFASGFHSSAGMLLITPADYCLIIDFRYIEAARNALGQDKVILINRGEKYCDLVNTWCSERGVTALCFEDETMTVAEYTALSGQLEPKLVPAGKVIGYLRSAKQPYELERMRNAQKIAEAGYEKLLPEIHAGMSELDVQARLIYHLYAAGAQGLSFDPIVVSGPNSSMPHGKATERVLENGDFLTMDFGVFYEGYCSDMTRTVAVGYATEEMKKVYNIVLEAQQIGLNAACSGIPWSDVDKAAREYITDQGYGQYFGHGLGHGLGLEVHEPTDFDPDKPGVTPDCAVVSCEPGIYLPGKFGVRIEDCMILHPEGNENLMCVKKDLIIVGN